MAKSAGVGMGEKAIMVGALVIVLAAFVMTGVAFRNLSKERTAHAKDNKAYAERIDTAEKARGEAETRYTENKEKALKQKGEADVQIKAMAEELAKQSKSVWDEGARNRALSLDNGKLRNQLSTYARGPSQDTLSACWARANGFADLLTESDGIVASLSSRLEGSERLAGEAAEAAAKRAIDQNTCVTGWPH